MQDREKVYEEKIAPLIKVIQLLCEENGIPMVAGFQCSSSVLEATHFLTDEAHARVVAAAVALSGELPVQEHSDDQEVRP